MGTPARVLCLSQTPWLPRLPNQLRLLQCQQSPPSTLSNASLLLLWLRLLRLQCQYCLASPHSTLSASLCPKNISVHNLFIGHRHYPPSTLTGASLLRLWLRLLRCMCQYCLESPPSTLSASLWLHVGASQQNKDCCCSCMGPISSHRAASDNPGFPPRHTCSFFGSLSPFLPCRQNCW